LKSWDIFSIIKLIKKRKKSGDPDMNLLDNLKIKSKLRIPIILLLILLSVFVYFYFHIDAIFKSDLRCETITEASKKIRALSFSITDYLNQRESYEQLNKNFMELSQLMQSEEVSGETGMKKLISLETEYKKAESLLKKNLQLEKQVIELIDSYFLFSNELMQEKGNQFLNAKPAILRHVFDLNQKIANIKVLFLEARTQWEKSSTLMEFLDQIDKDTENEGKLLVNTDFVQFSNKVKEILTNIKDSTTQFIENTKSLQLVKRSIFEAYNKLSEWISQMEASQINTIETAIKSAFFIFIIIIATTILLTIVLSYIISRSITTPINAMIERAHDLAVDDVDMTKRLEVDSKDEIGELSGWFNKFLERFQQLIKKVKSSSDEVHSAVKEISSGSENLANRTSEHAASITETSSTLEKIMETIRHNTENSAEADMMLVDFNQEIQEKSSLIDNVTNTMTDIFDSSNQIDNFIKVINDISFQTNLLALNAAVEAARAGDAGRGFAVVAAEVRNLAQKTAESSKSIQDIVIRNVESTQKGMTLVKDTSDFFGEIVGVMGEIVQKVSGITRISREQSANIEQITQTIVQMEQIGNRNADLVGELNESSRKVKDNAMELQSLVAQFKLDEAMAHVPEKITRPKKEKQKVEPKPSPSLQKKQKDKEKELGREERGLSTPTEDDFFGSTNDEGFEEF
jgi:methyl-accepting chemotaxis protein